MEVKRGAIVTVAASGDFAGKPRPAVVSAAEQTRVDIALRTWLGL
jgi:hypothetical protein